MHNRIFEIVKVEDGADYTPYMTESDFYDVVPYLFDYVDNDTDLASDIDWLKNIYGYLFVGEDVIEISIENRRTHFEKQFEIAKEIMNDMTLDKFATWSIELYNLRSAISKSHEFYIYRSGCLEPFDEFIRDSCDGQYEIISSMDYHW